MATGVGKARRSASAEGRLGSFTRLYSEGVATLAVTNFMLMLQEAWRRCAPVLVEQLARYVLLVEPRALTARFTTSHYDNGYFFRRGSRPHLGGRRGNCVAE